MKYLFLATALFLSGCASQSIKEQVEDSLFEAATGKDYSRNPAHCERIKRQCAHQDYAQWNQKNGQIACACNS
ncbi:hypothetical protein [Lacimicrobium alkaliphilum]|uniref:Lipoprotein n=1 Tax=Lacimicrobium alkaliphilum TaxID=1526571 RepID=A0A0U3B0J6_9ALTE|nr:hypothetical protein [Lacimicrobium alkaliphilum]ALS97033.1 hypothetical protein AT746_01220 [Lacimicrobium alkaliphilum]